MVEEVAPEGADGGDDWSEGFFVAGDEDVEAMVVALDVHDVVEYHRFTVDVGGAFVGAVYHGSWGAQRVDECV